MGKVTIIIECLPLTTNQIEAICQRSLGAFTTTLELNAGDPDLVGIYIVPSDEVTSTEEES